MPKFVFDCVHADTCIPDYWGGHHLPHICIPVYRGMSITELKQALRDEVRQGFIMGSVDDARLLSADFVKPEEEKRFDSLTRAVYAAINRIQPSVKGKRKLFMDLDPSDPSDDCDIGTVYAYFVFVQR